MLELCYNFQSKLREPESLEGMEMDTDVFYLAFAAKESTECIREKIERIVGKTD